MHFPRFSQLVPKPKLKPFLSDRQRPLWILDVGCGNHSPTEVKRWFPAAVYHGLDREIYNNSPDDLKAIDRFYNLDLTSGDLGTIPDNSFDLILMAHIIEHITNGEEVIASLSGKLKSGGRLYVECPAERSLTLPSAVGCLNFYDDPTHVRFYSLDVLREACIRAGLEVVKAAVRRDPAWLVIDALLLPMQIVSLIRHRKPYGYALWDLLGFAHYVVAVRPELVFPGQRVTGQSSGPLPIKDCAQSKRKNDCARASEP
jgi:SAM-dependent methyltransferase